MRDNQGVDAKGDCLLDQELGVKKRNHVGTNHKEIPSTGGESRGGSHPITEQKALLPLKALSTLTFGAKK